MSAFADALRSGRVLLMDGAMGTELQRAGIRAGECYEMWNLLHPLEVARIHETYVTAGAEVLLTNTFQANPPSLRKHHLEDRLAQIIRAGIAIARRAAGPDRFVVASVGPWANPNPDDVWSILFACQDADAILLETLSTAEHLRHFAMANASGRLPQKPLLSSFTYRRATSADPWTTFEGLTPERCAEISDQWGALAIGVNCGRELDVPDMADIVHRYRKTFGRTLIARPNAGTPLEEAGTYTYPRSAEAMAHGLTGLLDAGATMVGGCCGTTPAHIAAFREVIEKRRRRNTEVS
jgi:5-methyltetrahydrofolate--homocysteine methyltransferase